MFGLGVPEILIIALILLLIFGAKRLPGIGTGLGQTVRELGKIKEDFKKEKKKAADTEATKEAESESESLEGKMAESLQQKLTDKVVEQVPGIKQARQIKNKADKIKKIVS
jgi:sec-independent protein translocase protein TatA